MTSLAEEGNIFKNHKQNKRFNTTEFYCY